MLCYKDSAFCSESKDCGNNKCYRKINMNQYEEDCKRCDFDFPIAFANFKNDECGFIPVEDKEDI